MVYKDDFYFFEVNTKYITSSVMKTTEFSQVRSTSENSMFSTHVMTYLLYSPQKSKFIFYFILFRKFTVNQLTMLQTESQ